MSQWNPAGDPLRSFALQSACTDRNIFAWGPLCDGAFQFCDAVAAKNVVYLYFVTVVLRGGGQSGPSNIVAATR